MCGRLSCYCALSTYSEKLEKRLPDCKPPSWEDSDQFQPSPNLAPTRFVPILHRGEKDELIIRPMKWGIVLKPGVNLHNVRIETLSTGFFKALVANNRTCGVLCDGFYEWKAKKPFFFYDARTGEFHPSSSDKTWTKDDFSKSGPPLTVLAGVYRSKGSAENYEFSVITREAPPSASAIHHRCPVVLQDKESIMAWLDRGKSCVEDSLKKLGSIKNESVAYYEVSERVNSTKYQETDCLFPKSNAPSFGALDQFFSGVKKSDNSGLTSSGEPSTIKRRCDQSSSSPKKKLATTSSSRPLAKWLVKSRKPSSSSSPNIEKTDSE